jgi:hypothetical protein
MRIMTKSLKDSYRNSTYILHLSGMDCELLNLKLCIRVFFSFFHFVRFEKMLLRFPMTVDALFHRYASTVLEVHKMNEELNSQLRDIAEFTAQLGSEEGQFSNTIFTSAGDPDPQDPHVFGPPGSGSNTQRSGSGVGSFPFPINLLSGLK